MSHLKKFFYYISNKRLTVGNAAILLGSTYLINNVLGLVREIIIANKFGAERTADIFFASFKIPDLIFQLLILGALSSAFIPVLVEHISKDRDDEVGIISNSVLNFFLLTAVAFAGLTYIFAPQIVPYIFPGFFRHTQETGFDIYKATVNTTRIMLLSPIFFSISGLFSGILNSYKRFLTYSLAPIVYNLSIIFSALFLTDYFEIPVYGLAFGVVFGAFLHAAIQFPEVLKTGFRYHPILRFKEGHIMRILKLMLPRTLAIGVNQINILVDTVVASFFVGGISVITYANDIQTVPTQIFGIAIATAIFPSLAENFAKKDMPEFMKSFSWSFRRIIFFLIPATVGMIVLRAQIVRLIFGFGNFSWESTRWTTMTLLFFAVSLVAQGLAPLVVRGFYAIQDTKTPLFIGIFVMILNALLTVTLPFVIYSPPDGRFGIAGVALAFSIASFANIILLLLFLHKKIGALDRDHKIFESAFRLLFASGILGITAHYLLYFFDKYVDTLTVIGLGLQTLGTIAVSTAVYLGLTYMLKCEEIRYIIAKFKQKQR